MGMIGPLGPAAIGFSGDAIVEAARMADSDGPRSSTDTDGCGTAPATHHPGAPNRRTPSG
jgi:hypothetical protein